MERGGGRGGGEVVEGGRRTRWVWAKYYRGITQPGKSPMRKVGIEPRSAVLEVDTTDKGYGVSFVDKKYVARCMYCCVFHYQPKKAEGASVKMVLNRPCLLCNNIPA